MFFALLAQFINLLANLIILLVIVDTVLTYFLSPDQPVRRALDRLVEPMLAPIRRLLPMTGPVDFSPMILIIVIELVARILSSVLWTMSVR